ncbi:MAG TPA: GYD domain-containing protein, partial [Ignavibacteriaceae bacterium]|nr:GYD domain-containing protein [Ignavibacteriaceae bacterium]
GKLISFYYCFGDYDGVVIAEMPDNIASLTAAFASYSEGNLSAFKTTILISVKDAMIAMEKASAVKLEQPKD